MQRWQFKGGVVTKESLKWESEKQPHYSMHLHPIDIQFCLQFRSSVYSVYLLSFPLLVLINSKSLPSLTFVHQPTFVAWSDTEPIKRRYSTTELEPWYIQNGHLLVSKFSYKVPKTAAISPYCASILDQMELNHSGKDQDLVKIGRV